MLSTPGCPARREGDVLTAGVHVRSSPPASSHTASSSTAGRAAPVQLWRRCAKDIWKSALPLSAKLELLLLYFGIRKFATHWVSLGFFCTIVPLSVFTPEVSSSLASMLMP